MKIKLPIKLKQVFYPLTMLVASKFILSASEKKEPQQSIYNIKVKTIDGQETNLSMYKGKKLLIVNVASECGYTPQYAQLQELHEKHQDKVVVLGFPANNFGEQEPGSNAEIKSFCSKNYNVTFPMFEKIDVIGENKHPLYQWLSEKQHNGWNTSEPKWNFSKYLVDENGKLLNYFSHKINPLDTSIVNKIIN